MAETEEIVENHGAERSAEFNQLVGWGVEFSAFVAGADDEDTHVVARGSFDRGPVSLIDVVPVQVDVIELVGFDRLDDDIRGSVSRKADVAQFAFALELMGDVEDAAGSEAGVDVTVEVDAVDAEEIDGVKVEELERSVEGVEEFFWIFKDDDFGLDNELFAGKLGKDFAELNFGGAVGSGGFDVGDAKF